MNTLVYLAVVDPGLCILPRVFITLERFMQINEKNRASFSKKMLDSSN